MAVNTIGELVIELKIKTEALEQELQKAKSKLKELEGNNSSLEQSNKSLEGSYLAMSAIAVASLMKIGNIIKSSVSEYNSYVQSMSSLNNVASYTGESINDLNEIMQDFSKYGLTQSDLATVIKNFTLMGYSASDTKKMIEALTNSAIKNRSATYSVSEALKLASEGYKQGLSTLSDSAGVTENLSVMQDKYAQSIGKTASQLTDAERNQAYLTRTMEAAEPFAGATEEYLNTLAGKQGEFSQAMRETKVAFAEALEPVLTTLLELGNGITKMLGGLITEHSAVTSGLTSFIVTITTLTVGLVAFTKVMNTLKSTYSAYKGAVIVADTVTKKFTTTIMANPVGAIIVGLSLLIGTYTSISTAIQEHKKHQEELKVAQEEYNEVLNDTIKLENEKIDSVNSTAESINNYIEKLQEKRNLEQSLNTVNYAIKGIEHGKGASEEDIEKYNKLKSAQDDLSSQVKVLNTELGKQSEKFKELFDIQKDTLLTEKDLSTIQQAYNKQVEKGNAIKNAQDALNVENVRNKKKEAATLVETAKEHQRLYDIYKKGAKGTQEYESAITELSRAFPEAVSANGILKNEMQDFINKEKDNADDAWNSVQNLINKYIEWLNIANTNSNVREQIEKNLNMPLDSAIPKIQTAINLLNLLLGTKSENVGGVNLNTNNTGSTTKSSGGSSGGSSSYSNKALDNYKKELEYKKSLDKLSLQDEIAGYEYALRRYAKTTEEKQELRVKIYELNKELAQKEKDLLDEQTEDYEAYIQEQINLRGAEYDVTERTRDYDNIIRMHKRYLDQIMKDERLSLDERKEIYREELQTIRDYEQQKRDLRVEAIDNTVSQLTDAITKQLEEMQEADKEAIDKNLEEIEKWKEARIEAINEEYDARIEAIQKELDALDKAEEEKSRAEEDAEYEKKKKRLEELVAYEHDAVTKANYEKELKKLMEDYQKTIDERALQDKKDALKTEQDLLKEEQDKKIDEIEEETEKKTEEYNKQLEELEAYYDKQMDMAQETAEKMLLNVDQNQQQILDLLHKYGDAYEITGQSLGEKLAQGMNEGLSSKIAGIIQNIQDSIDNAIENKIKNWSSNVYKYETGVNKPDIASNNIVINQNNSFETTPEMPSETYRKLNNVSQKLAEEFAGM